MSVMYIYYIQYMLQMKGDLDYNILYFILLAVGEAEIIEL